MCKVRKNTNDIIGDMVNHDPSPMPVHGARGWSHDVGPKGHAQCDGAQRGTAGPRCEGYAAARKEGAR